MSVNAWLSLPLSILSFKIQLHRSIFLRLEELGDCQFSTGKVFEKAV
ncbi:hypothetical protein RHECNPAF_4300116 [Rhizobium etli CNPAF512]|nr:hypothetical protein RHECNPAF_4300116 [Rhizobium etli CNPAF512]